MKKKNVIRFVSLALGSVIGFTTFSAFAGCAKKGGKKDSIVLMTEELSGLFNPFYATSGTDMDVVGMTQIGMLSTDENGNSVAGDNEATVVKAFEKPVYNEAKDESVYTFVLKNDLKFSDGKPLTMNDVMFNMYEYLDPVYTGSSTMYSIDIKGLTNYRTQTNYSDGGTDADDSISSNAAAYAYMRVLELVNLFETEGKAEGTQSSYKMTKEQMLTAIDNYDGITTGYMDAVATVNEQATMTLEDYQAQLEEDYLFALDTFKKELEADFKAAKESYDLTTAPYKAHADKLENDIFKFFLYEGYIKPKYRDDKGKEDKTVIESFDNESIVNTYKTQEAAIERVFTDKIENQLNDVLTYWGTAGTLLTKYTADATTVLLYNQMGESTSLLYPYISGIVSLGHLTEKKSQEIGVDIVDEVTVDGTKYKVAREHNPDGTPKNADEYDVLQITINGKDPKAIYNFSFTVAPAHYYGSKTGDGSDVVIDIANNKFGVEFASSEFQSKVIQSQKHVEVPVGAGPFQATNSSNGDNPSGSEFWKSNIVYFKKNTNFMFPVKAEKLRFQVVSPSNAIDKLVDGEVDYVTPQFTESNAERLTSLKKKGYETLKGWQLGYGYIGINAGKVPNINVRKAIMSAMQTSLALDYYQEGTCKNIDWPMSMESWAYPYGDDGVTSAPNYKDYMTWTSVEAAKTKIKKYTNAAKDEGVTDFDIKFTIAGASITEHPTYTVFKQAAELLNGMDMGWKIEVKADSQALTKLSTGSLEVWAAAWGSTIDPDMYQVYHKDSTATSVYAWGYREIKGSGENGTYYREYGIIDDLSELIDEARSIVEQPQRKALYKQAMNLVLDLAVEMPVYQRMTLYAYNSKTIKGLTTTPTGEVNSYTSPLEKIWELELA